MRAAIWNFHKDYTPESFSFAEYERARYSELLCELSSPTGNVALSCARCCNSELVVIFRDRLALGDCFFKPIKLTRNSRALDKYFIVK